MSVQLFIATYLALKCMFLEVSILFLWFVILSIFITARIIIDGLLDRDVGHVYAADCNEQQLELTAKMFINSVGA